MWVITKSDQEGLLSVSLSDGGTYSAKELYEKLKNGDFSLKNAWLTGSPERLDIYVVGKQEPEPFEETVKILFEKRTRSGK
jgi:hypothetical protein